MAKKDKVVLETEETMTDVENHAEPRVYELGFHLDPELGGEEAKKAYQGIRSTIEKAGTVVAEGEPQKIQLAYTISRSETGGRRDFDGSYFAWIVYETNGEGHDAVVAAAKAEKRIFRFIDLRTTKEAAEHSSEIHEIMMKAAEREQAAGGEEEVSETELDAALKEVEA